MVSKVNEVVNDVYISPLNRSTILWQKNVPLSCHHGICSGFILPNFALFNIRSRAFFRLRIANNNSKRKYKLTYLYRIHFSIITCTFYLVDCGVNYKLVFISRIYLYNKSLIKSTFLKETIISNITDHQCQ